MVIKPHSLETPLSIEPEEVKLCDELQVRCFRTNDPCEAGIAILEGYDIIITRNKVVKDTVSILKSMITIGRAFQVVDSVCRSTSYGVKKLREISLRCHDYSYPRALFVMDEISPSIHFLKQALERSKIIEDDFIEVQCGIRVPRALRYSYPFSQLECPKYTRDRIARASGND